MAVRNIWIRLMLVGSIVSLLSLDVALARDDWRHEREGGMPGSARGYPGRMAREPLLSREHEARWPGGERRLSQEQRDLMRRQMRQHWQQKLPLDRRYDDHRYRSRYPSGREVYQERGTYGGGRRGY